MLVIDDLNIALDISDGKLIYYSFDPDNGTPDFKMFGEACWDNPQEIKNRLQELADSIEVKKAP